jgi:imidazoleglycerol-phosphate dehydratase
MTERQTYRKRETAETQVEITLNLDGTGQHEIDTGVPFMDHMLTHVAAHGLIDLEIQARGDIEIDDHHTVEDVGITLGQALAEAVGDKRGLTRYGYHVLPMDEALVLVALDFSGRGLCVFDVQFTSPQIGRFDVELVPEFMRALATNAGITLHVRTLTGANSHHIAEACFKALGRALRQAVALDPRRTGIPSTKGVL